MSFTIYDTFNVITGEDVLEVTSTEQKVEFVEEGLNNATTVIQPLTVGSDIQLTDALLLQARWGLWIDPSVMSGASSALSIGEVGGDTAAVAAAYQELFGMTKVNDSVSLTFPYTEDATTGGPLNVTIISGATFSFVRSQTQGGAFGNTFELAATNTKSQTAPNQIQVRADNVTAGAEIITFNVVKQGLT
jgi:hypothetical protein